MARAGVLQVGNGIGNDAGYKQSLVFAQLSSSSKQTVVGSYIQSLFVIRLYGSDGVLLLTVQIECNLAQVEMLQSATMACMVRYKDTNVRSKA